MRLLALVIPTSLEISRPVDTPGPELSCMKPAHHGDHWRDVVDNDLVLADGLRAMLPPYTGPAITLSRGESARNRQRRTYGLSWSATAEVARAFASSGMCRTSAGGSVLLETLAPPEAIICAPVFHNDRYDEQEYLVDRRRLRAVRVLARYRQLTHFTTPTSTENREVPVP